MIRRMIYATLIGFISFNVLAQPAHAEVKQVRMKIAGYLCGN
ncbi:MAG TPA: hypothetical protein VKA60_05860 [Blastocatellia bacterium]|nr:hypothetical protein [Blastocatellia bacterium]